jgi:deoxyribonuclease-4
MPAATVANRPLLLGAHCSIAGGLPQAFPRALDLGCTAIQIFVKNPSQWRGKELLDDECQAFRAAHDASGIGPLLAHSSYLPNLAATDPEILAKSIAALRDELARCGRLGVHGLVVHPGAHLGAGEEAGLDLVARGLDQVLDGFEGAARILLELTAGQGSTLGYKLEHLSEIRRRVSAPARIGICVDTCHALAAGYGIDTADGYRAFWDELDSRVGLEWLGAIHLNDSKHPQGSRRDRHANVGEGFLGLETFARLLNDGALAAVPKIIETPSPEDCSLHRQDLQALRQLLEARTLPA